MIRLLSLVFILSFLVLFMNGCAARVQNTGVYNYAMDGPPLVLLGDLEGIPVEGQLDRTCMAGVGEGALKYMDGETEVLCTTSMDFPPNEKGRVRGVFKCSDESTLLFTMRNLGPDQGLAVGRVESKDKMLVFFFHPSREEAERRLPEILDDIEEARKRQGE